MLRKLALSAVALFATDVTTQAVAPQLGSPLASVAYAADFTGRIKRVKIKRRRVGSGFRITTITNSDSADSVASADLILTDSATGEVLEQLTLDEPNRARVRTSHADSPWRPGDFLTVTLSAQALDWNGDPFGEQQEFEVSVDGLEARTAGDGSGDGGWKVRARQTASGALRLVVLNDNRSWSGDGVTEVSYSINSSEESFSASIDEVRQRMSATLETDLTGLDSVQVATTLYDVDGALLDTYSSGVRLTETTAEPALDRVRVRQTNSGAPKLVSWTIGDGRANSLQAQMVDNSTGEAVLNTVDDSPVLTQRGYFYEGLEFEPGESPEDFIYLVLLDLINEAGDPVGEQYEVELTVPALGADGTVGSNYALFANGGGAVSFLVDADGYSAHVALQGDELVDAVGVNVIFEEPFEGPAPLQLELNTELVVQWDKWIQQGTGTLPDDYTLTTALVSEDGEVLQSVTGTGGGTGVQYSVSGNGKGTKKSNIQVMNIIALL